MTAHPLRDALARLPQAEPPQPTATVDTEAAAADQQRRAQTRAELEAARAAHTTASGQATPDEASG